MSDIVKKLKTAVIREQYVRITGNWRRAIILNQLIYWADRVKDIDGYLSEENSRRRESGEAQIPLTNGWFYKKTSELIEELMLDCTRQTLKTEINFLIEKGFIRTRNNPSHKWDRTLQYRVEILEIYKALRRENLSFPDRTFTNFLGKIENTPMSENEHSKVTDLPAIPEITSEITKENPPKSSLREGVFSSDDETFKQEQTQSIQQPKTKTETTHGKANAEREAKIKEAIAPWFHRRPTTRWSLAEDRALKRVADDITPEDIELLNWWFQQENHYQRFREGPKKSIASLLNAWGAEVEKARRAKESEQQQKYNPGYGTIEDLNRAFRLE